jgi:hypothetical protein
MKEVLFGMKTVRSQTALAHSQKVLVLPTFRMHFMEVMMKIGAEGNITALNLNT